MSGTAPEAPGTIVEVLSVNVAVRDLDASVARLEDLGFPAWAAAPFPDPPAHLVDVTHRIVGPSCVSLVSPTEPASPIARLLEARGEGIASITLRTDDLDALARRWSEAGVGWWKDEPVVIERNHFGRHWVERARMNWTRTSSLAGLTFEVIEFGGEVRERTDPHGADRG